ncbi:transcriptional regulator, RpiR family [Solimonas aquatica]|uniref:Transcriptional regulator, RpiR family n=1 Tax=Solimonas aquatica TaxID=489703 RepID=A0A1H9AQB3_9GAMM|nr:SIS domain-containing protein [Solimonas aquatica]SEP79002.1 transcriptional regulator, RpiR family [Solimonas aquatica]
MTEARPLPAQNALLLRIAASREQLRPSERNVADFVLLQPSEVLHLSIAELAARVGVSQPTVARFAAGLGFSGFRSFKLSLAQSLGEGAPLVHQDVAAGDGTEQVIGKVFDRALGALLALRQRLPVTAVEAAVNAIAGARRVEFYGLGNSGIVAQDAQHKLFRYGLNTACYSDSHSMAMAAGVLQNDDVVLAISASGRSSELCAAAEIARESGACVIALTTAASPLARRAAILLPADVPEDPDLQAPMVSRLAHLMVLDVLAVALGLKLGPAAAERLQRSKQALRARRIRETDS